MVVEPSVKRFELCTFDKLSINGSMKLNGEHSRTTHHKSTVRSPSTALRTSSHFRNFSLKLVCYNELINNKKEETDNLIVTFFEKGGRINEFYLQKKGRNPSLVYLNGWFRGRNIREAILRALADQ